MEITGAFTTYQGKRANVVYIRDISSRKKAEANAQEYREGFQALVQLGNDTGEAIVILQDTEKKEGGYVFVNDLWSRITGYSVEELMEMSAFELISHEYTNEALRRYRTIIAGKVIPKAFEVSIIAKSGTIIPVEVYYRPVRYQGRSSALAHIRDISDRKQAEETLQNERDRLHKLLEYNPVGILENDWSPAMPLISKLKARGVTDFNNYFNEHPDTFGELINLIKVFNFNRAGIKLVQEDLDATGEIIKNRKTRLTDDNRKEAQFLRGLIKNFTHLIEGRPGIAFQEYPTPTSNGQYRYVREYFSVMPGHEADLSWIVIVIIDISERIKAENALNKYKNHLEDVVVKRTSELRDSLVRERELSQTENKLRRELEDKINSQAEFIRRLVHDFKTPLLPMLGASEMLIKHTKNLESKQMAMNINRGAKALSDSVNDLLDVMRGEIGILKLEFSETDIYSILIEVAEFLAYEAERKRQQLSIKISKRLPLTRADSSRIRQVVLNLLENALRYTPSDGKITVKAYKNRGNVVVNVFDTGPGIKKQDKPYIFEPYYSTERRFRQTGGLGLGLPLAKMIIELHGGRIWARNQVSGGAVIGFSIPIQQHSSLKGMLDEDISN